VGKGPPINVLSTIVASLLIHLPLLTNYLPIIYPLFTHYLPIIYPLFTRYIPSFIPILIYNLCSSDGDLNKLDDEDLKKRKAQMNITFEKNRKLPGDPGFKYDVQVKGTSHFRFTFSRLFRAFFTPFLRLFCAFFAPFLRLFCAFFAPFLRLFCAFFAPFLRLVRAFFAFPF
jgi:hypothetical protein